MQKDRAVRLMEAPKGTKLMDGPVAGKMKFVVIGGKNFKVLHFQITPHPFTADSLWTGESSPKRTHIFEGLKSQSKYCTRTIINGSNGQEYISDPISRVAQ